MCAWACNFFFGEGVRFSGTCEERAVGGEQSVCVGDLVRRVPVEEHLPTCIARDTILTACAKNGVIHV